MDVKCSKYCFWLGSSSPSVLSHVNCLTNSYSSALGKFISSSFIFYRKSSQTNWLFSRLVASFIMRHNPHLLKGSLMYLKRCFINQNLEVHNLPVCLVDSESHIHSTKKCLSFCIVPCWEQEIERCGSYWMLSSTLSSDSDCGTRK